MAKPFLPHLFNEKPHKFFRTMPLCALHKNCFAHFKSVLIKVPHAVTA